MASQQQIKQYLAYWVQLGKGVVIGDRPPAYCKTVSASEAYSPTFELLWQKVESCHGQQCHITGTEQELAELFSERWQVTACYRCELLIPQKVRGIHSEACPCSDLDSWPNLEIPKPRLPLSSNGHLAKICQRLTELAHAPKPMPLLPGDPGLMESAGVDCALKLHLAKAKSTVSPAPLVYQPQLNRDYPQPDQASTNVFSPRSTRHF